MERHELKVWLGPADGELTDAQIDRLLVESDRIAIMYPDEDYRSDSDAALSAAVQILLGENNIVAIGRQLVNARVALYAATAAAKQAALMAVADGMPVTTAAQKASIDRQTLIKLLGRKPGPDADALADAAMKAQAARSTMIDPPHPALVGVMAILRESQPDAVVTVEDGNGDRLFHGPACEAIEQFEAGMGAGRDGIRLVRPNHLIKCIRCGSSWETVAESLGHPHFQAV